MSLVLSSAERIRGCLLGGAVGDALGADIEFLSNPAIRDRYGPDGVTGYVARDGRITDDTQMTLFTAEGLIRGDNRHRERGICDVVGVIHRAYLRWLLTQEGDATRVPWDPEFPGEPSGWLVTERALWSPRAPGNTCLSALRSGDLGTPHHALNDSKGCGGVMRVAPIGLVAAEPFALGVDAAAITHSHPSGYLAAGACAEILAGIGRGEELRAASLGALGIADGHDRSTETCDALAAALALAAEQPDPSPELVERLGGGWVAEEALAIAVYCALTARDFRHGVLAAVNHSGDSDSTGSICGNLLGALLGPDAIPHEWVEHLAERDVVEQVAADLVEHFVDGRSLRDLDRYPPW